MSNVARYCLVPMLAVAKLLLELSSESVLMLTLKAEFRINRLHLHLPGNRSDRFSIKLNFFHIYLSVAYVRGLDAQTGGITLK